MAQVSYLNPDLTFNRSAIMAAAWASARQAVQPRRPIRGYTPRPLPTLRKALKDALRRIWDLARGHRACELHRAAAIAQAVTLGTLSPIERAAMDLREARVCALMADSTRRMVVELSAIDARAVALGVSL